MSQYFEENASLSPIKQKITITYNNKRYDFSTMPGIFSKNKFDYGSKLLLDTFTKRNNTLQGKVLDLGCGSGVIGLLLADTYKNIQVDMVDVTTHALNTSKYNATKLNIPNVNIFQSNIYENITTKYNYILTNPPIRAGKDIIRKFLLQSINHLESQGELWFVMRKDHGVKSMIKELNNIYIVNIEIKSKGFYVVKCILK